MSVLGSFDHVLPSHHEHRSIGKIKARRKKKDWVKMLPMITLTLAALAINGHGVNAFGSFRVGGTTKHSVKDPSRHVSTSQSSVEDLTLLNQDETNLASQFLHTFEVAWRDMPAQELVDHFFETDSTTTTTLPFWRDMVAFTWNIETLEGSLAISKTLQHSGVSSHRSQSHFRLSDKPLPPRQYIEKDQHVLEFWSDLILDKIGTGKAHFRLVRQVGQQTTINNAGSPPFKIHTLLTTLLELSDRPFRVGANRIRGHETGAIPNRKYWPERLVQDNDNPFVLIVGGGQAGLALGARLHLLQIPYLILEAGPQPGTAWRKRYPSLHLHDPCWYNHMPYLPFPESWPVFCPRDKIADWLEFYAKAMDLNIQTNTVVTKVTKTNGSDDSWDVHVRSPEMPSATAKTKTISAKHVVFATGNSSKPRLPKGIPGRFMGLQMHSSEYQGGRSFAGKKVVVVGSNNSGWDIVQDLWEQGAKQVTMIQRSPSMVVSPESVLTHGLGSLYYQDAPLSPEEADLVATSTPYKQLIPKWKAINQRMKGTDHKLLKDLAEAGYQLDEGPDGAGIFAKSATEGGGFYIDMGATDLIIQKLVQIRYADVLRLEPDGIMIRHKQTNDEEKLDADVIIYATGFETIDQWMAQLCGEDIATRVGRTWGLGLGIRPHKDPGPWEGELRNMWKPTPVSGLWFHGGNLAQSRHYSRFLALQLAARYMNIPTVRLARK
jgi:putative flavoprotein involved in K+ transport